MHQKTYKYKRVSLGELVLDDLDNSHDASTDLLRTVAMIVSANPEHNNLQQQKRKECMTEHMSLIVWGQFTRNLDLSTTFNTISLLCKQTSTIMFSISGSVLDLWADVIQFAIAQSPQHMLCCITTHSKIEGMERREQLPPDLQTNHNKTCHIKMTKCDISDFYDMTNY